MKNIILLLLTSCMLASCTKNDIATSHYCGYPTKKGSCHRKVAGVAGYCYQHK